MDGRGGRRLTFSFLLPSDALRDSEAERSSASAASSWRRKCWPRCTCASSRRGRGGRRAREGGEGARGGGGGRRGGAGARHLVERKRVRGVDAEAGLDGLQQLADEHLGRDVEELVRAVEEVDARRPLRRRRLGEVLVPLLAAPKRPRAVGVRLAMRRRGERAAVDLEAARRRPLGERDLARHRLLAQVAAGLAEGLDRLRRPTALALLPRVPRERARDLRELRVLLAPEG